MGEKAQDLYNVWKEGVERNGVLVGIEWDELEGYEQEAWRFVVAHVEGTDPVDKRTGVEAMTERHGRMHPEDPGVYSREA